MAKALTDSPLYSSGPPKAYVMKCTCSTVLLVFTNEQAAQEERRYVSLRAGGNLSQSDGSEVLSSA